MAKTPCSPERLEPLRRADPLVAEWVGRVAEWLGCPDAFEGASVLVTGGAGFIGSWLVDLFWYLGASRITVVDNLSTGSRENIEHLLGVGGVELLVMEAERYEPQGGYDYVLHLAARPSPDDYQRHPIETLLVSSEGTRRALEEARRSDATFLFTSTSEVYGRAEVIPTPEDYWGYVNPIGPRSPYDEGKRYAEALTMAYVRSYGLDARIARIFNTYGPRLDWRIAGYGRVVTKFILQALEGKPFTIHGDGTQTRSFLYIADLVEALALLASKPGLKGTVVNIGSDRETRIIDLARLIARLVGVEYRAVHLPPRPDDPPRRRPDIRRARELLGWSPRTSLEEGLAATINWIRSRLGRRGAPSPG